MKLQRLVSSFGLTVIIVSAITGCDTQRLSADMSVLNNIPPSQTKQIDKILSKVNFRFQVPTHLPFTVTGAFAHPVDYSESINNTSDNSEGINQFDLALFSKDERSILVRIYKKETSLAKEDVTNKQMIQLSNGTKAVYGDNKLASQLIWTTGGITYSLESSKPKANGDGEPDLAMSDLVQLADSFK